MSSIRVQIPSKTFLVGEYTALNDGPAVVINSKPLFAAKIQLDAAVEDEDMSHPFHPESPAGLYFLKLFKNQTSSVGKLTWSDPHRRMGGFGGSSAQFLSVYFWNKLLEQVKENFSKDSLDLTKLIKANVKTNVISRDIRKESASVLANIISKGSVQLNASTNSFSNDQVFSLREQLRSLSVSDSSAQLPSGYDLIAQMSGGLTVIDGEARSVRSQGWSIPGKAFTIVRTGLKVNTHEHLDEFSDVDFSQLAKISKDVCSATLASDYEAIVGGVTEFQVELRRKDLTHIKSFEILSKFLDLVDGGKCCGALGADSIILLHSIDKTTIIQQRLAELNKEFDLKLLPVASSADLASIHIDRIEARERVLEA